MDPTLETDGLEDIDNRWKAQLASLREWDETILKTAGRRIKIWSVNVHNRPRRMGWGAMVRFNDSQEARTTQMCLAIRVLDEEEFLELVGE